MIRINLLSDREAIRKETTRQQVSIFVLSICLLFVILGGIQFALYQKKKGLDEEIRSVNQTLKELDKKVGEVERYKEAKKELETKIDIIHRLQKGKFFVAKMLDDLAQDIPEKMWLDQLEIKKASLSMEGYAIDNETVATFMRTLQTSGTYRSVELLFAENKQIEGIGMKHFSLQAAFTPFQPPEPKAEETDAAGGHAASAKRKSRTRH